MDRVFADNERSFSEVRYAAVAIRSINDTQRHLGLLHKESNSEPPKLLHLGWQHDLRNEDPKDSYLWVDPAIPGRRLRQLAAFSRKVWRANGTTFPYALSPASDCFNQETGQYLYVVGTAHIGLTCATFVVAIFDAVGLSLIEVASWPPNRVGDAEWRSHVISNLRRHPSATASHIASVESQANWVRYRPEDVAGAATVQPLPADFATSSERAKEILKLLSDPSSRPPRQAAVLRSFLSRIRNDVMNWLFGARR